jgi:hypothetical protein
MALFQTKHSAEVHARHDRHRSLGSEVKKVVIVRDDNVRFAIHCTFENAVVIRIGRRHAEDAARNYNARGLRDLAAV